MPIFGVIKLTFESEGGSMRGEDDFFSVARTMPLVAMRVSKLSKEWSFKLHLCLPLIPSAVTPWLTAFRAYSTCRS